MSAMRWVLFKPGQYHLLPSLCIHKPKLLTLRAFRAWQPTLTVIKVFCLRDLIAGMIAEAGYSLIYRPYFRVHVIVIL